MSSIIVHDACLDYIMKTGSESIKKTAVHLFNRHINKKHYADNHLKHSSYRALNHINLHLQKGDRIGLLGRNGAGKSTLLRLLAKVYKPNIGSVEVNGKISTLFNIGLGMNMDATGYENIINLAVMCGMKKKDALNLVKDVELFTELGTFLNQPVRTYSSGMSLKLSFAVATAIAYDIMLIDEVIGVGDMHFMEKATTRLAETIEKCHILVLTSHSMGIVRRFCNKVAVLDQGKITFLGDVEEGIKFYEGQLVSKGNTVVTV